MLDKLLKRSSAPERRPWKRVFSGDGLFLSRDGQGRALEHNEVDGYLVQLQDDGLAHQERDGVQIAWDSFYLASASPGYEGLVEALELPPYTRYRPVLGHTNGLIDHDFSIYIAGWLNESGVIKPIESEGAVLKEHDGAALMRPEQWSLTRSVVAFARRPNEQRTERDHRLAWARIRQLAVKANADMEEFLWRTVVLSPERLKLELRKERYGDRNVIEVLPGFDSAPEGWLPAFDRHPEVKERYDLPTEHGIVQVVVGEEVGRVLREIKRMPGRRAAGARAQAFILNPFAVLGEGSEQVIEEEAFEAARHEAGILYERFTPVIERDGADYPVRVGLLIECANSETPVNSETRWLSNDELRDFVERLEGAIIAGYQLLGWQGYDLELQGDASEHLKMLKDVLARRSESGPMITYAEVHDLSRYYERVEEIGVEKPYYSPYIAREKDSEGWFPESIVPLLVLNEESDGEPLTIPLSDEALRQLRDATMKARNEGIDQVDLSWLPKPIGISEAEHLLVAFDHVREKVEKDEFHPSRGPEELPKSTVKRKTLIIRPNIGEVDYQEVRREALLAFPSEPEIPNGLDPAYTLLPHQLKGLAWLQHLYGQREQYQVRGAVLADDMGLGKTLQLLAFMVWLVEKSPSIDPLLVVAPVSLLENWKEEAEKFLLPGVLPMLTAYGDTLATLRVPRQDIDQRLRDEDGLDRFLRPGWVGGAKVVLTTYETLRDLEFSFAAVKWSFMVCDEAQKVKNPAAMVTRAAKKQNVGFKIACTGTPVENNLADLWCLFDLIQPGLLGALNDFGVRYRRPIEARTEEERMRVEELRGRISPQLLRRSKADVASNLPRKIIDSSCGTLQISADQRGLYAKAVEDFRRSKDPGSVSPFKNHLELLHYLRLICTDPRRHGLTVFRPEPLAQYRVRSPKLDWLLVQLEKVRKQNEKAIVFCEFREIQRLLQHYIAEAFQYRPDIINGDTVASSTNASSRQKRIKSFQEASGFGVLILSPVAVGFGVNIQAANHVIHYTRTWNPAKEDQATDRAYRIGQTKDVYVYCPVVRANDFTTFDVKLDQLLTAKRALAQDMLNGTGDVTPVDFDVSEVVPPGVGSEINERVDLDMALRMDWRYFEGVTAALWSKQGFTTCYCTPGSNDNGVDVVCYSNGTGVLIQVKTSGQDGMKLGWETVKDVVAGEAYYRRKHRGVSFKKIGVTNQFFNAQAHEQARLNDVELVDQEGLSALLKSYPVTMMEVERFLFQSMEHDK